jgi:hypothetical protein
MKTPIRELIHLSSEMNTQWTGRGPTPHPNPYARHRDSQTLNPHCVSSIPHPLLKLKKPDLRFGSHIGGLVLIPKPETMNPKP